MEEDGLVFLTDTIRPEPIKEPDEYQGIRLRIDARLGKARISLQVDIGFGDTIIPGPVEVVYPTLLEQPPPRLLAYPRETVIAEKYQAIVMLGIGNSRMKDFYDLWFLARQFAFEGEALCKAIKGTFDRRGTPLPHATPLPLTHEFATDAVKATQWKAFLNKSRLLPGDIPLSGVIDLLEPFLMAPTRAIVSGTRFLSNWPSGGPWV